MLGLRSNIINNLTTLISFSYKKAIHVASFNKRIKNYQGKLDRYDRQFHMRPPDLSTKNDVSFPITVPFRLRHRLKRNRGNQFVDDTSKIHWNRLTPNEILLAFENVQYLQYHQMMEGLKCLSQIQGQEKHDWNSHPWVSQALDQVNKQYVRIKKNEKIPMYYLMKKLQFKNEDFWKKIYNDIEENIYDLYPSEFQTFFLRYYKVSDQYFSPEMKDKFITLMENRIRSFSADAIIKIYQIYEEENRLNDFWIKNAFIPLFKSVQYCYTPSHLCKIFRFMMVLGHQKDDRLYDALYARLTGYKELTEEELDQLEEVILEVKDLFVSHRVNSHIDHLKAMRQKMAEINASKKKQIPIHEVVRQDLIFFLHKRKLKELKIQAEKDQEAAKESQEANQQRGSNAQ